MAGGGGGLEAVLKIDLLEKTDERCPWIGVCKLKKSMSIIKLEHRGLRRCVTAICARSIGVRENPVGGIRFGCATSKCIWYNAKQWG